MVVHEALESKEDAETIVLLMFLCNNFVVNSGIKRDTT